MSGSVTEIVQEAGSITLDLNFEVDKVAQKTCKKARVVIRSKSVLKAMLCALELNGGSKRTALVLELYCSRDQLLFGRNRYCYLFMMYSHPVLRTVGKGIRPQKFCRLESVRYHF